MLLGSVPMIFIAIATAPFVSTVRIKLPQTARTSRDALLRFASKPPPTTPIVLTTIRMIGFQRTSNLTLGELRPIKATFGMSNLERIVPERLVDKRSLWAKATYWMKEPRNRFFVGGEEGVRKANLPKVWPLIKQSIERNAKL
jgi:hypothetical protein